MTDVQNETRPLFVYTVPERLAAKTKVSQVGLVEITPDEELMASRRARNDAIRLSQELAKEALRMVNGQRVTSADSSVDTAWNNLPAKIRQLVMAAYTELHNPDAGDANDFFEESPDGSIASGYLAALGIGLYQNTRDDTYERKVIKKLAFLGRYGHQPIKQLMSMPSRYVNQLVEEVNDLIEGEIAAMKRED